MSLFKSSRLVFQKVNPKQPSVVFFDWQKKHLLQPDIFKHFAKFVEFYKLHFIDKSADSTLVNELFFKRYFVDPIAKSKETSTRVNDFLKEKNVKFVADLGNKSLINVSDRTQLYKYLLNSSHLDENNRLIFNIKDLHHKYYQVGDVIVLNNKSNNILPDSLNLAVIIKLPSKDDLNMVCISTTEDIMSISKNNVLFRINNLFDMMSTNKLPSKLFSNLYGENPVINEDIIPETLFHHIPRLFLEVLESLKLDLKKEVIKRRTDVDVIIEDILKSNKELTLNDLYQNIVRGLNLLHPETPYSTNSKEIHCSIYITMLYYLIENKFPVYTNMVGIPYVNLNKSRDLKLTNPDFNILDINTITGDYMEAVQFAEVVNKYKGDTSEYGDINLYDVLTENIKVKEIDHIVRHDKNQNKLKEMFKDVKFSRSSEKTETKYMNQAKAMEFDKGKESAIYAIDSASTVEVDDGLSLEYVNENAFKVNCYISAVSEFFLKDKLKQNEELLMDNIFARNSSLYYLSKVDKMICIDAINDYYSLSSENTDKPALKFSVVIKKTENDYKVDKDTFEISKTSSYKDLKRITYEEVEDIISSENKKGSVLQDLFKLATFLRKDRKRSDFYKTLEFNNENTVQVKNKENQLKIDVEHTEKNSQILVSEFMLLFNHLTSLYCFKNKLPIIYRSCPPSLGGEETAEKIDGSILTYTANPKYAKFITPESYYTMEPKPHYSTGFELYTHITSPLRRLPDFLNTLTIMKHLSNKTLTSQELNKLKVVFEQDVCVGSQKTKKFNKYLQKYYLLKALKEDNAYLTELLKKGGVLTTSTFADNKQSDLSHKDELLPIQNVSIVKKNVTTYKNNLEMEKKKFDSLDRVFVIFEGCIVADLVIDSKLKTNFTEGQICKNLVLHSLDPVKLQFSLKLE